MTQMILNQIERRPALSFHASLMLGAMLATLAVVAYAGTATGMMRAHIVLQGFEVILLTLGAGFIASALHAVSLSGDVSRPRIERKAVAA